MGQCACPPSPHSCRNVVGWKLPQDSAGEMDQFKSPSRGKLGSMFRIGDDGGVAPLWLQGGQLQGAQEEEGAHPASKSARQG